MYVCIPVAIVVLIDYVLCIQL